PSSKASPTSFEEEALPIPPPPRPAPLTMPASGAPVAFGNLLETPTAPEEEQSFVETARPSFVQERDWRTAEVEEEEEEESSRGGWRRSGGDGLEDAAGAQPGQKDWRETAFESIKSGDAHSSTAWTPTHEKTEFVEAAESFVTTTAVKT